MNLAKNDRATRFGRRSMNSPYSAWAASLATALVAAIGCIPPQTAQDYPASPRAGAGAQPPPHIAPPPELEQVVSPELIQALVDELGRSELQPGTPYVAPEQIMAMAIGELARGNVWDSALLLDLATYRALQQAALARRLSAQDARDESYDQRSVSEMRFKEQHAFTHGSLRELASLRVLLRRMPGATGAEPAPVEDAPPAEGEAPEVEPMGRRALGSAEERLVHPELAQAFLRHLQAGRKDDQVKRIVLESTPLVAFRRAALPGLSEYHPVWSVPDTIPQLTALRDDYLAALTSSRPETRSGAAFVLGVTEEASAQTALRAALASEQDERAKITLHYALLRLGDEAQLAALELAMSSTRGEVSRHAATLLSALPPHLTKRIDPAGATRRVSAVGSSASARVAAAALLGVLARERPLPETSVSALLVACAEGKADLAESACVALGRLKQLDRSQLLALMPRHPGAAAGLFKRWSHVAEEADLPALDAAFERERRKESRPSPLIDLIRALHHVPGGAATRMLAAWFVRSEPSSYPIVLAHVWTQRPDVDAAARRSLLEQLDAPKRLYLLMATGDAAAAGEAEPFIEQANVIVLAKAAATAAFAREPAAAHVSVLWRLARFNDRRRYPEDAVLRWQALASLFHIELRKRLPEPPEQEE
jgi:hypothetical protein